MRERLRGQRGQTTTEYALLVAFVVIGLVSALYAMMPAIFTGTRTLARNASIWLSGP